MNDEDYKYEDVDDNDNNEGKLWRWQTTTSREWKNYQPIHPRWVHATMHQLLNPPKITTKNVKMNKKLTITDNITSMLGGGAMRTMQSNMSTVCARRVQIPHRATVRVMWPAWRVMWQARMMGFPLGIETLL